MAEPRRTRPAEGGGAGEETGDGAPRGTTEWQWIREGAGGSAGRPGGHPPPGRGPDLFPLIALLDALKAAVPRELEQQFSALLREALLTLRALIDWYLERLEGDGSERRVEDIPIE